MRIRSRRQSQAGHLGVESDNRGNGEGGLEWEERSVSQRVRAAAVSSVLMGSWQLEQQHEEGSGSDLAAEKSQGPHVKFAGMWDKLQQMAGEGDWQVSAPRAHCQLSIRLLESCTNGSTYAVCTE